ncbi:ras-related protein Rab7 [Phoenix dactylifera]|uniref:Ras-related protein Rab7 n=1 Tax=Phoenix dactylifera TaxID=42345 RepID=A0A8B9AFP8_PHODC|nr:ras-related protein Rab7 [Phoenix dactylifera]
MWILDHNFRFIRNRFREDSKSTLVADISAIELRIGDRRVTLQLWDTAGQEKFQSLAPVFYRRADCCVLVFDVTNPSSFSSLYDWHKQFLEMARPSDREKFPFVLLGNKADTDGQTRRRVPEVRAKQWCSMRGNIRYFETSARDNQNVDAAFFHVAKLALANNDEQDIYFQRIAEFVSEPEQGSGCAC